MFKIISLEDADSFMIEASGKITKEDYINLLVPFLDGIKDEDRKVKL